MTKRLKHLSCEERPRELGMFSLEKGRSLTHVQKYLKGGCKEDRDRLFPLVLTGRTRQEGQTDTQEDLSIRKYFFLM